MKLQQKNFGIIELHIEGIGGKTQKVFVKIIVIQTQTLLCPIQQVRKAGILSSNNSR